MLKENKLYEQAIGKYSSANTSKENSYVAVINAINPLFSVKNIKHHQGREGYGLNADLYFKSKNIGHILDEGNGGQISYYETTREDYTFVKEYCQSLPKYSQKDYRIYIGFSLDGDESEKCENQISVEDFVEIVSLKAEMEKEFNKQMRKLSFYDLNDGQLWNLKATAKDLNQYRNAMLKEMNKVFLHLLPKPIALRMFIDIEFNNKNLELEGN